LVITLLGDIRYISFYIRNSVDHYGTEEFVLDSISAILNMNVNQSQ